MKIILFVLAYIVIASAAISGFVLAEFKMDPDGGYYDLTPHIIFGLLWPITLMPCICVFWHNVLRGGL